MAAQIRFHLTGGQSNTNGNASLGGEHSDSQLAVTAMNNLFDDVSPTEATNGSTEYRAIDVTNTGDALATGVSFYMDPETSSPDTQLDAGIEGSSIDSATSIANETSAPPGVTFTHHADGSPLSLPDIPVNSYCRLWIRRTVSAGANNTSSDRGTFNIEYA